jgi:starch phosphorylase
MPDVGWALGDGQEHGDDPAWDAAEAAALYERLEQEVIPEFYTRNDQGIPTAWVARMRESMARLTPRFSASRAVTDYTEQHYLPAASAYRVRAGDQGAVARQLVGRRNALAANWGALRFGSVTVKTQGERHDFMAEVFVGNMDPALVRVELFANGRNGGDAVRQVMTRTDDLAGGVPGGVYQTTVSAGRPAADYTARVVPRCEGLAVPLEASEILWQR